MSVPLTFGVEFEFLIPFLADLTSDPEPFETRKIDRIFSVDGDSNGDEDSEEWLELADDAVYGRVRTTLQDAGFPAVERNFVEPLPTQWDVSSDASLMPTQSMEEAYGPRWVQIEIASPALAADANGFNAPQQVCRTLNRNHRMFTTPTCGLHVHVGNGLDGFNLVTIQNLAAFLWTFENQLASLHPPERHFNAFCHSMRRDANISLFRSDLVKGINAIYQATDERYLIGLVHLTNQRFPSRDDRFFNRFMAYNFENLVIRNGKKTVEFRQFAGTMNPEDVTNWIQICCRIVQICKETDLTRMKGLLTSCALVEEKDFLSILGIGGLLRKIGMVAHAEWATERTNRLYPQGFF